MAEDAMVGWHHQFNGHEFGRTPGNGEGQGGLVYKVRHDLATEQPAPVLCCLLAGDLEGCCDLI